MGKTNDYMNNIIRNRNNGSEEIIIRYVNGIKRPIRIKNYELYHSSPYNFEDFDDKYIGINSLGGHAFGRGHYFTADKNNVFGSNIYKVNVKLRRPFISQEREFDNNLINMGYSWNLGIDKSDFLASKGYDSTIIKNGNIISEVVIYTNDDKKIKIIEKE